MKARRNFRLMAAFILSAIFLLALGAEFVAPYSYAKQFRDAPAATPSATHLFGTDALGRDEFSRLLYGTRVSLLLAPAAALLSTLLAGILGGLAGFFGGWWERTILASADLLTALPLLFVLLTLRATLPLDAAPMISAIATFLILSLLGWASSLRVVWAAARNIRDSDFLLLARSNGSRPLRIIVRQILPNLRPVLAAQFWVTIPVFILAEATLSMLGLGVMEPLPSWGNLLRGLEDFSLLHANPWIISPLILLILVVFCFQFILPAREELS
jgi:peptide/nickel transport system permease protein